MPDTLNDTERQAIERYLAEHGATRPGCGQGRSRAHMAAWVR